ncbi:MAG: hypothetical protein ACO35E_09315 [Ilumatobacteraceae bacterium]
MSVPTPIVEWAPAKGPYETVDTYYDLDGTAGTFITTPDAAAWTFSGTYRLMLRVQATDWTAAATQQLATHYGVSGAFAWRFSVTTAGALQWARSTDGLAEVSQTSSAPSLSNGTTYWLGGEYVTSTGAIAFYQAADAVTMPTVWSGWTLVSSHTMTSGTPYDSASRLVLGATDDDKGRLTGRVYQFHLYSSSTVLASLDADLDGYVTSPSVQVSSTGQTWTLQGAASLVTDWVDISEYVQDGSVQVGRQYEVDRFNAGTAALTLVATTRLFDPDNTAGTYYGQLVPMRQFRIRMVRSDTVYPVFRGYVTDWGQAVPSADRAIFTTVQLADAFALLAATLVPSVYEQAVLAKGPKIYYRFDNANALIDSSGNGRNGVFTSTPTLVDGLLTNDASRAWSLNGSNYAWVRASLVSLGLTPAFEFWLSTTATTGVIADFQQSSISVLIMLRAGKVRFWDSSSTNFYETTAAINDGVTHHCYFDTTTDTWRIDGAAVSTTSGSETSPAELGGLVRTDNTLTLGNNQAANYPFVGTLDEFAGYASNVGDPYDEGVAPLAGQTTGVRVGALLDLLDWPAALRDLDAGDSTMQIFDGDGLSMLDAVQQAADTELGQTYVDAYGRVHHRSRSSLWRDARSQTAQSTFGDTHSGEAIRYAAEGFSLVRDETLLRNPVSASRQDGATITVSDTAGITKYGQRAWAAPVSYDLSDNVVNDRATFLLQRYKELTTRLEAMTVHVHRDPATLTPVVGRRQIGDRITVERTPLGTGNQIVSSVIIEGIAHRFAPRRWSTTYRASPIETTVFFILDDATYGVLDDDLLAY